MIEIECPTCHIDFQVTNVFYKQRKQNGKDFFCPNGHVLYYPKAEIPELKRQLAKIKKQKEVESACLIRRIAALQGVITKMKKKVKK